MKSTIVMPNRYLPIPDAPSGVSENRGPPKSSILGTRIFGNTHVWNIYPYHTSMTPAGLLYVYIWIFQVCKICAGFTCKNLPNKADILHIWKTQVDIP